MRTFVRRLRERVKGFRIEEYQGCWKGLMTPMMQASADRDVVLIVDDVPENLAVLCDALDGAGLHGAGRGRTATARSNGWSWSRPTSSCSMR